MNVEEIWSRFGAKSDAVSSGLMMREMARMLQFHSHQHSAITVRAIRDLTPQLNNLNL